MRIETIEIIQDPYLKSLHKDDSLSSFSSNGFSKVPIRHVDRRVVNDAMLASEKENGPVIKDVNEQRKTRLSPDEQRLVKFGRAVGNQGIHLSRKEKHDLK